MSNNFEEFKLLFLSRMVENIIRSGIPPASVWPIPTIFRQNATIMEALLSKKGFELFTKLDQTEQDSAIKVVENCGPFLAEAVGCQLFEEWDKQKVEVSEEKKQELREKYKLII